MDESGERQNPNANGDTVSTYRSPSDVASPISQKITAMKTKRINKNPLKQRSLFASTVSSQHLKQSQSGGVPFALLASQEPLVSPPAALGETSGGAASQSEGSMADDELDGSVLSDRSEDTVVMRRLGTSSSDDGDSGGARVGRARRKHVPQGEDKTLDEGYLADESERN